MKDEIVYLDDNDSAVKKENSTHGIIRKYDKDGYFMEEIFFTRQKKEEPNEPIGLTENGLNFDAEKSNI